MKSMQLLRLMKGLALALCTLLVACTTTYDKALVMPEPIRLQDPLPGGAVVYLMTAPYDSGSYSLYAGSQLLARLRPGTYTVLFLEAGTHTILTRGNGLLSSGEEEAPPLKLALSAGDRLFFHVSGMQRSSPILLFSPAAGAVYAGTQLGTVSGTKIWKQCAELDAQGLMSIETLTMPESAK
jgi:hypothetical protein